VISASLYIIACTTRNRIRTRLQRLREPRYLIAAIVGVAYFYFAFFARLRSQSSVVSRRRRGNATRDVNEQFALLTTIGPVVGGLALMAGAAVAWLLPFGSVLLSFSDAEIEFLFSAPVSRRVLLLHRFFRSQSGILFSATIVALAGVSLGGYQRVRVAFAAWLVMCAIQLYFTGVCLARARARSGAPRVRRSAWLPLAVLVVACGLVGWSLVQTFAAAPISGGTDALDRLVAVGTRGIGGIALAPFVALTRPFFAPWPYPYLAALAGSVTVVVGCLLWVLVSDRAFDEAADALIERKAARPEAAAGSSYRARSTGWHLAPVGRVEIALAWKAATQTVRSIDKRIAFRLVAIVTAVTIVAFSARGSGVTVMVGGLAVLWTIVAVIFGPQILRLDLRQDLEHLDLLKTWPVRSSVLVRGELIWPTTLLTVMAWIFAAIGLALSSRLFGNVRADTRLATGLAAMALVPALVLAQLIIQNAAALLFPGWVSLGNQRSRGIDAMGQRFITLGGTWLVLLVALLPGAAAGAVTWFVLRFLIGPLAIVPGAIVCAALLLVESIVATEALGAAYDRIDLLAIERPMN
jgi:hypothetical protein